MSETASPNIDNRLRATVMNYEMFANHQMRNIMNNFAEQSARPCWRACGISLKMLSFGCGSTVDRCCVFDLCRIRIVEAAVAQQLLYTN